MPFTSRCLIANGDVINVEVIVTTSRRILDRHVLGACRNLLVEQLPFHGSHILFSEIKAGRIIVSTGITHLECFGRRMIFHIIELYNTIRDTGQGLIIDEVFFVCSGRTIGRKSESIVAIMDAIIYTTYSAFVLITVVHHSPFITKRIGIFKTF